MAKKKYGEHNYDPGPCFGKCKNGCGCEMASSSSSGPVGLDPFGTCPNNPKDGKLLGGNLDYEYVVNERIESLVWRLLNVEEELKKVRPNKRKLADALEKARLKIDKQKDLINCIREMVNEK